MSDNGQKWLDGELWNFVRGAAIDLEIPLNSPREEQLYVHMKQACGVHAMVDAVECTAPAPTRPSVEFCICDDCERKRADNERFLKPGLGEHDHTPASAYPARYVAPKEKP